MVKRCIFCYVLSDNQGRLVLNLVVVVEKTQSRGAVVISIDAHHGLGGSCQWVLQEGFPGFILCGEATLASVAWLILEDQDSALAVVQEKRETVVVIFL